MRRWNGWGEESINHDLNSDALEFLTQALGQGQMLQTASKDEALKGIPPSRVEPSQLFSVEPYDRLSHARGQSIDDWLALKSGKIGVFPDAVAFPRDGAEVRAVLETAMDKGYEVIPYGGGTSVAGHISPLRSERPILTVSMRRINQLKHLDEDSQLATIGAGAYGPEVEAQLRGHGYTLGHFPQSFELSTLGGWIATRSSGQQSLHYGRVEGLFAGGTLETPRGTLNIPTFPASAAGPDIREMVLGSEGRMGILTDVKVRVSRLPELEKFYGIFFPSWQKAKGAVRELVQEKVPLSMLRLSNVEETRTNLILAGHKKAVGALEAYLQLRGPGPGKCLLMAGVTGEKQGVQASLRRVRQVVRNYDGVSTGQVLGQKWAEKRFSAPYLREALWQKGYLVDTVETATDWVNTDALMEHVEDQLRTGLVEEGEAVHVFTHLSHVYSQGSSCYTTYVFRNGATYDETRRRWQKLKDRASRAIVAKKGTISHQHGVGKDHKPYLAEEKDPLGMEMIESLVTRMDPKGLMNPGALL